MPSLIGRLRVVTAVAGVTAVALGMVAGCSASAPSADRTVAALWYGTTTTGQVVGGVTPVTVGAEQSGEQPFSVDLSGFAGSPEVWNVTAWDSATTAMLSTGTDPRGHLLRYSVGERMDGPSAGALLTVAAKSLLEGRDLDSEMTMTGTILPNGSIGPVAGIPNKLAGAAAAGITTVLIPQDTDRVVDLDTDELVDPVEVGRELGVEVLRVGTLAEAYALMSGQDAPTAPAETPPIDSELLDLLDESVRSIQTRLRARLSSGGALPVPRSDRRQLAVADAVTDRLVAAGDLFSAYSTISLAEMRSTVNAAARRTARSLDRLGMRVTRSRLSDRIEGLRRRARRVIAAAASVPVTRTEQFPALAEALTWGTGTLAILDTAGEHLERARHPDDLPGIAGEIARAGYRLGTYLPVQVQAVELIGRQESGDPARAWQVLDAYADLLAQAGDANLAYATVQDLDPVSALRQRAGAQRSLWRHTPAAGAGQETVAVRLATALSYYVASSYLVVMGEAFRAAPDRTDSPGALALSAERLFRDQIAVATAENSRLASRLSDGALDPSFVLWGDDWGLTWADPVAGARIDDRTRGTGLTYQWYATVQGAMLSAVAGS